MAQLRGKAEQGRASPRWAVLTHTQGCSLQGSTQLGLEPNLWGQETRVPAGAADCVPPRAGQEVRADW